MDNDYKVYMHRFPNGKVYIGITKQTVEERWRNGEGYKTQLVHRANGEERSRKISDAMKARNVHNPEIHKKMLDAAAKKCSKSVVQKDEDGSVVAIWASAAEIERNLGINHVYISRACHSESGKLCGYVWEFA